MVCSLGILGGLRLCEGTGKDWIVREEHGGNEKVPPDHNVSGSAASGFAEYEGEDEDVEEPPEEDEEAGITVDDDPSEEEEEEE